MLKGVLTALVTPFKDDAYSVDYEDWSNLIEWQISSGVDGLVVFGTTGESATLTKDEKIELTKKAIEVNKGRVPIIVGSCNNNTKESVEFSKKLASLGADAALAVCPYYNKPTQAGLVNHFSTLAKDSGLPIIVYNIPGRTNVKLSIDSFKTLSKVDGIVGVKQAVDSVSDIVELSAVLDGTKVKLFAGDDPITYSVMTYGGVGVVSASANIALKQFKDIIDFANAGEMKKALKVQQDLMPLIETLFLETNPAPVKEALKMMGKIKSSTLRLPLVQVSAETEMKLKSILPNYVSSKKKEVVNGI